MYKKLLELDGSEANWIRKLSDNSVFPKIEGNRHYQEYLKWLDGYEKNEMGEFVKVSEGNTPEPADEV